MSRRVVKALLRWAGSGSLTRTAALSIMKFSIQRVPHGRARDLILGPVTSYLLPREYRTPVTLRDGTRIYGGPRDVLTRMALYFGNRSDCWEPQTLRLALSIGQRGGDIVVGGAHVGYFAIRLARALHHLGVRVFAFEPMHETYRELLDNIALNVVPNLTVECQALGGTMEQSYLYIQGIRSSLLRPDKGPADRLEPVAVTILDGYIERSNIAWVSLLLLDIEGAELPALHGARNLLHRDDAPDVLFEVIPGGTEREAAAEYLRRLGYRLFYVEDDYDLILRQNSGPVRVWPLEMHRPSGRYFNVLATRHWAQLAKAGIDFALDSNGSAE